MKVYKHKHIKYADKVTFKGIEKESYFKGIALLDKEIQEEMHKNQVVENVSRQISDDAVYDIEND